MLAPGVGLERYPQWGTFTFKTGLARTWENNRDEAPTSFPQVWSETMVRWKIRPNINLRELFESNIQTTNDTNYWFNSVTQFEFRFTNHFSLATGYQLKWDHQPARQAGKTTWTTITKFIYSWARENSR